MRGCDASRLGPSRRSRSPGSSPQRSSIHSRRRTTRQFALSIAWVVATGASTTVGVVLATRCRGNPIGWLLLANGLVVAAMGTTGSYADYTMLREPGALPGGEWALLFSERGWPLLFVGMTAIAWVFPDGRLPSPRWRPYALAGAASVAVMTALSFVRDEAYGEKYADFSSPLPTVLLDPRSTSSARSPDSAPRRLSSAVCWPSGPASDARRGSSGSS